MRLCLWHASRQPSCEPSQRLLSRGGRAGDILVGWRPQGYLEKCPQLAGRTFGEAAFYFPDATIFALVQASRCALAGLHP